MPLSTGDAAPWFRASTEAEPEFTFDSVAGRFVLLLFTPPSPEACHKAVKALAEHRALFDEARLAAFVIMSEAAGLSGMRDMPGLLWVRDYDGAVRAQFASADRPEPAAWLLLDPTLRVLRWAELAETEGFFGELAALPAPEAHAGASLPAPVLIAPRIFEPDLCERLIALHAAGEPTFTGVMRDQGQSTAYVMDVLKKRRDVIVADPDLVAEIRARLERRLFPHIERSLGSRVTRIERYLISCYAAEDGGVFHAHRDNTTYATAHRKFASSINLNADYAGGDLRFPEFGRTTYRPPVGGACVFSCGLLHEATRVTEGRRYAFLPFLFDEEGEAVRAAYEARVGSIAS